MPSSPRLADSLPPRLPPHQLLAALVSSSDDAIISESVDGTITSWNRAAEKIFGYQAEEIVGKSIFELVPPELHPEQREILAKVRTGERIEHFESRRLTKSGTPIFVSITLSPIRDDSGVLIGISKVARDVTAERQARGAQAWLASIIDSSDDAIISKDLTGIITSWNKAAVRIFGYEPHEIVGRSVLTIIPPEMHADEPMILGRLGRGERIDHFETVRVRKDGTRVEISLTVSPIRDEHGVIVGASKVVRDITSLRDAERVRHRLAAIVDSSDDAIISKDLNGMITSWNQAAARLFGYTEDEVVGKPITLLMRPAEAQEEPGILARIARGEKIEHYETVRLRKNGELVPVSLTISAILDASGKVIGASKIARDVSKQKQADEEREILLKNAQESREEAEALVDAARALSSELNLEPTVQRATDIATKLSGANFGAFFYNLVNDRQESYVLYSLSGAPREAFEKFGLPRNTAIFSPTFKGEGTVRLDDVTADPRYGKNTPHHGMPTGHLPVRSYLAVPVISRTGEVIGGMFFGHPDVGIFTARVERLVSGIASQAAVAIDNAKLYSRIQNSATRLNFSLAALALGDWNWDVATDQLRLSDRAAEIFGVPSGVPLTRSELRGRITPGDRESARAAAAASQEAGTDYNIEYRIDHPQHGLRWVMAKGRPQLDEQRKVAGMMGVVQDITDRKNIETELRRSREQLAAYAETLEERIAERTARLQETIGELEAFSYSVSHDMRTPLRAMQGYAERLLTVYRDKLDEEAVHHLERIAKNSHRLQLLVRDVLTYSRVSKGEIELSKIDLEKFLDGLLPSIPDSQRDGVTIELLRPMPAVLAHEAYLSQVLTNLIGNAVKFAAEGRRARVEIRAQSEGDVTTIDVCDNGIGIDAEHFGRIFEIFGRVHADKKFDGTGIGLSIVRKAVQRMGGQVSVHSKLGEGSCFSFTLKSA